VAAAAAHWSLPLHQVMMVGDSADDIASGADAGAWTALIGGARLRPSPAPRSLQEPAQEGEEEEEEEGGERGVPPVDVSVAALAELLPLVLKEH